MGKHSLLACSPGKCSLALFRPQIKEMGQKGVKATLVLLGLSLKMVERGGMARRRYNWMRKRTKSAP